MVKGTVLPPLDKNVKFVPALRGLYTGTQLVGSNSEWWINLEPPNQPAPRSTKSTFDFVGDYILRDSLTGWSGTRSLAIEDGKYDFYTGAISFMTREERIGTSFVTGHVLEDGSLTLFWPSAPKIDVRANPDHSEKPFVLRK